MTGDEDGGEVRANRVVPLSPDGDVTAHSGRVGPLGNPLRGRLLAGRGRVGHAGRDQCRSRECRSFCSRRTQVPVLAEARDGTWQIEFVEEATDGPWKFKLRNLGRFDEVLGRRVLNGFCRCFVHVDRLNSLISCMYTSEQYHGRDSVAYSRDLNTLVWFTVGTLRELARAIEHLRSALARCGRLDPDSAPWVTLRDLERRWKNDDYRKMRDQAAFHVDESVIERGLNNWLRTRTRMT